MWQYFHSQWKTLWNNMVFVIPIHTYKPKFHNIYATHVITDAERDMLHHFYHHPSVTIFILFKDGMIYIKSQHLSYYDSVNITAHDIIERMLGIVCSNIVTSKIHYVKYDGNKLIREMDSVNFTNAPYLTSYASYCHFCTSYVENHIMSVLLLTMHKWHTECEKYDENTIVGLGDWIVTNRFLIQQIGKY